MTDLLHYGNFCNPTPNTQELLMQSECHSTFRHLNFGIVDKGFQPCMDHINLPFHAALGTELQTPTKNPSASIYFKVLM